MTTLCYACGQPIERRRYYDEETDCTIIYVGCLSSPIDCDQSIYMVFPMPDEAPEDMPKLWLQAR